MLEGDSEIESDSQIEGKSQTKKRVRWDDSVVDNEGKAKPKRRRLNNKPSDKRLSIPKLSIALVEKHFEKDAYERLEEILSIYPEASIIKLFSHNDYHLFGKAAVTHNVNALNFIIEKFSELSWHMLSSSNVSAFRCFLYHTCALAELKILNTRKRIECFKIFLEIDRELVEKTFYSVYSLLVEEDVAKHDLKIDFVTALYELYSSKANKNAQEDTEHDTNEEKLGAHVLRYINEDEKAPSERLI
ncbi:MAG: hypothetical protein K0R73_887 [Candidatus Midichloriaceae bacterium]|jgi:hypothetical protein|nr:hypothetical protein [Candidatus Midichloriaceae bacterium]